MKIVRVTPQNLWQLENIERTPSPDAWVAEAEDFLLEGRAVGLLRLPGTTMLASIESDQFTGVAISYDDLRYQETARLGSIAIDHRHRSQGIGGSLFRALLDAALRSHLYCIWLVHPENESMLTLSRSAPSLQAEATSTTGYIQFFAERN
jgi:GNAT superfamily N-acetyltransferase